MINTAKNRERAVQRLLAQFPGCLDAPALVTAEEMARALLISVSSLEAIRAAGGFSSHGTDENGNTIFRSSDLSRLGDAVVANITNLNFIR
jgi:hypothetical protein